MRALKQAARYYLITLWSAALVLSLGSLFISPAPDFTVIQLLAALIFTVMLTVADLTAFQLEDGRAISLAVAILVATLTSVSWPLVLAIILVGTVSGALARDVNWWQTISVVAVRWIAFLVAKLVLGFAIGGEVMGLGTGALPYRTLTALIALLGVGAVVYLIERVAEAGLESFNDGVLFHDALRLNGEQLRWYVLMLAPLGGLLGTLWQLNGWAFMLGFVPIFVVYNTFGQQAAVVHFSNEARSAGEDAMALSGKLEKLQSLMNALITSRDVPTMLNLLCERLAALMNANHTWVVLLDDQQVPLMVASHNLPMTTEGPGPFPVPYPKSYENVLGRQRVMMFTDQYMQTLAPLPELTRNPFWSVLFCIPLVDEQRVMGAICLTFAEVRGLKDDEQRVLMAFASQAATVIQNARLFRRLQESQAELVQSSKLAAVGTFAAGIAHEFNNLLAGMLGYAQLGLATDASDTKNESLKVVVDTCKRGKSITGSLLTFARRQEPRRELADLYEAVQGTLTLMEIELRKHNIQIVREIRPVQLTICDAGQISQVFLNLLTNARDAMKPDGGTLTVSLSSDDKRISLAVSDNGCGIPDAIRDKIFEPFVTTKGALGGSATPGTGLGLSVSYGIVKSHGGSFEIESAQGKGTTMRIHLPIIEDPQAAVALAEAEQEPEDLPNLRLLLVDDDPSIGTSLKGLLEHIGHSVTVAVEGQAALDIYRTDTFDMVLTDLSMPGMSGLELLSELRVYDPEVRVLVFTGQALDAQVKAAQRAGALAVMRKPFELEEVLKAMRNAYFQRRSAALARL